MDRLASYFRRLAPVAVAAGLAVAALAQSSAAKADVADGRYSRDRDDRVLTGVVTYFHRFDLTIVVPGDRYRQIHLHQGTILRPLGLTLRDGMRVVVRGEWHEDGGFQADEIDLVRSRYDRDYGNGYGR